MAANSGVDRIAIVVRDLDAAKELFESMLGVALTESHTPQLAAAGLRIAMSFEAHLELMAPQLPLPAGCPEVVRQMADFLRDRGGGLFGVTWRVPDLDRALATCARHGLDPQRQHIEAVLPEYGVHDLREVFFDPRATYGVPLGLSSWRRAEENSCAPAPRVD
jgi:catechol 2,3-dioxygenase-like lactoylglutathione lyase family enzyme